MIQTEAESAKEYRKLQEKFLTETMTDSKDIPTKLPETLNLRRFENAMLSDRTGKAISKKKNKLAPLTSSQ